MKILFLGGDARYNIIIDDLIREGHQIDALGYIEKKLNSKATPATLEDLKIDRYDQIILPADGIKENNTITTQKGKLSLPKNFFQNINPHTNFIIGLETEYSKKLLPPNKTISYFQDENVKKENTHLTVEGILDYIKYYQKKQICILGYGNIGKSLYQKLNEKYPVKVGVITSQDKAELKEQAFYTTDKEQLKQVLKNSTLVINTVPANLIEESMINPNGFILDIASYPHGANKYILNSYSNYYLYLGIPSKYNHEKAGKILSKKISKLTGGEQ